MARMTLLEMTKNILNAIDSDSVNSIDDTEESLQVAETIKESYFDIIADRDWPFLRTKTSLDGLGDTNNPTLMSIPATINKVFWIRYNKKKVHYLEPEAFVAMLDSRTTTANVYNSSGFGLNRDPQYWTSYDDSIVTFDSINLAVESTLVASKCTIYAVTAPSWTVSDEFIPTLPDKMFPTLLAEAKSACFLNLKQQANPREESKARRGRIRSQNEAWKIEDGETKTDSKVNYGR